MNVTDGELASHLAAAGTIAFFRERQPIEAGLTLGVLNALQPDRMDYSPHPNSQNVETICATLLRCMRVCIDLTESNSSDMVFVTQHSKQIILNEFESLATNIARAIAGKNQAFWEQDVEVRANGTVVLQHTRGEIFWLFLFDQIHHRGQISTFLRPMGSKVPSIYGKSGDDKS